ncbi:MAG: hypothetical protein AB7D31_06285 [Stenotrophomonas sp.]
MRGLRSAASHLAWWKRFARKRELARNGLAKRTVIQIPVPRRVHVVAGMRALALVFSREPHATPLGPALQGLVPLFWTWRMLERSASRRVHGWYAPLLSVVSALDAALHAAPLPLA